MAVNAGFVVLYGRLWVSAVTLRLALFTVIVWITSRAAVLFRSPACDALIVMVPAPVIVRVLPLIAPGPLVTLKVTGRPEVAVAINVYGESP